MKTLAQAFTENLRALLTPDQWNAMVSWNKAETDPTLCHSHDFTDANEPMAQAFELVHGREMDLQSVDDWRSVNAAWAEAKGSWSPIPVKVL